LIAAISVGGVLFAFKNTVFVKDKKKRETKADGQSFESNYPPKPWKHGSEPSNILQTARKRFSTGIGRKIGPKDVVPFKWQVGGHMAKNGRPGFMRLRPSYILKPVEKDSRGAREVGFYEAVFGEGSWTDPAFTDEFRSMIPQYHGVYRPPDSNYDFLVLLDLTPQFRLPCVIDIKMGTQTFEPDAPLAKRRRENTKYPDQKRDGFRLVALRVWDEVKQGYLAYGKEELRSGDIKSKMALHFFNGKHLRMDVLRETIHKFKEIKEWFLHQKSLWFVSSSLLLVYEGDPLQPLKIDVKLIDFAHVRNTTGSDIGFIKGLDNIIQIFEEYLENEEDVCDTIRSMRTLAA